jgi:hypothetical protein
VRYDRTIVAYHGCDRAVAERLLAGEDFKPSENDYDWLGRGIYFWEYGADRALQFARDQRARGVVRRPAVVGALLQLASCFDLMDTRFTDDLMVAHRRWLSGMRRAGHAVPINGGATPDKLLRRLDCAVLNWYLAFAGREGEPYDSVRCGFVEGGPVYEGAGIHRQSHVQIAVRNPACIIGVFRPRMRSS